MARRLEPGARLVIATHNQGKLAEIADLLRPHAVAPVSAAELGLAEPAEDAPDFAGNARIKALAAARSSHGPALADDSGFCVAGLEGRPGVHSARWAGPKRDWAAAMARVEAELGASGDRRAWFVAALCLGWPDGHADTFIGRVDGVAVWPPRGERGFGYDPMFMPLSSASGETFGQMHPNNKHALSHRARAFEQLLASCLPTLGALPS